MSPNEDRLTEELQYRRRAVVGALAAGTGLAGLGVATDDHDAGTDTPVAGGADTDSAVDPVFGFPAASADVDPPVEPDHEVELVAEQRDGEVPIPEWHFEPVGLAVDPGETVRFTLASHLHTVTAFHPDIGFQRRVPEAVGPISSPVLWEGSYFLYTFEEPGVYDLLSLPYWWAGAVIRVVAGEASGPGAEPVDEPAYRKPFPNQETPLPPDWLAATVLDDPALDPENVLEAETVSWDDLDDESKAFPMDVPMMEGHGRSLVAALAGRRDDVETEASGCAHFTASHDGLAWHLVVEDIEAVTQAHVHEGERGEQGPVVAPMVAYTEGVDGSGEGDPQSADADDPIVERGRIDDEDLVADILEDPSGYYVNVHTTANPAGEIRGQLRDLGGGMDGAMGGHGDDTDGGYGG